MTDTRRDTIPEHDFAEHEHRELRPGIDRIHAVGAMRGTKAELSLATLDVLHWIQTILDPHAEWEDRWLYPEVDRRAGTSWATKLMSYEHQQIRDAAAALATARARLHDPSSDTGGIDVRASLFGLEALIRAHMAREERFLLPLLDGQTTQA